MPVNANSYGPYDAGAGANITENFWRLLTRWFAPAAVVDGYLNSLAPFGDSTGLQAKVNTGGALVRGAYGEWTSTSILGLAAVGGIAGGSERWDRLVVRNDFVNNLLQLDVLTGTAGASPNSSRPALTQTSSMYEMLIADVGPLVNTTTTVTPAMVLDGRWRITESGVLFYEALPSSGSSIVLPTAGIIPASGRRLEVDWTLRTNSGNGADILFMQVNGDTGATVYDYVLAGYTGAGYTTPVATNSTNQIRAGVAAGGTATAGIFNKGRFEFPDYAETVGRKEGGGIAYRNDGAVFGADWTNFDHHPASSAAIATLTMILNGGSYISGCKYTMRVTP